MKKGDRVSGLECRLVRSLVRDVFSGRIGAQYWFRWCDDSSVVFVVPNKKLIHSPCVKLSGTVTAIRREGDGSVLVWLSDARIFEESKKVKVGRQVVKVGA